VVSTQSTTRYAKVFFFFFFFFKANKNGKLLDEKTPNNAGYLVSVSYDKHDSET
jgi:hypothetical protein